jgi:CRP-like cAMP-binding protein
MPNESRLANVRAAPGSAGLHRAIRLLPEGGLERQAIEAGEIDAVIDYRNANVIVFPAARRALRDAASRKAAVEAPAANSVLAALPRAEYQRLLPGLEAVTLQFGEVLHEPGTPIRYVYFPIDCVVCLLTRTEGQRTMETGLVGHEGMVGISLALGVDVSSARALVQAGGAAMRMPAACFQNELRRCVQLQRELYRCAYVKLTQARQAAACLASHLFVQRLACWLLMSADRSRSSEVLLTQEYLAAILGVRRVSVTMASASLRSRDLINYSRGKIRILNRKGLESASCSCYRRIEALHAVGGDDDNPAPESAARGPG